MTLIAAANEVHPRGHALPHNDFFLAGASGVEMRPGRSRLRNAFTSGDLVTRTAVACGNSRGREQDLLGCKFITL